MKKQGLTVINLDRLVGADTSLKANLQQSASKELETKLMDNPHTILMDNTDYLLLFGLIAEKPQEAVKLLERAAIYHCSGDRSYITQEYFEKTIKGEKSFIEEAKQNLYKRFSEEHVSGPNLHWWITCEVLATVKDNPSESLKFFQKCYEQIIKNNKEPRWREIISDYDSLALYEEKNEETRIVVNALKTREFYGKAMFNGDLILKVNPLDLYKGNSSSFIEYFSKVGDVKEKKVVLRLLLGCDYEDKKVINWLNENYSGLIRDAALEPCDPSVDGSYLKQFGMSFIPEEEVIQVPKNHLENYVVLSRYLMNLEEAPLNSIGLIKPQMLSKSSHKTVIIPREGDVNWERGVYIIKNLPWYSDAQKNYIVYKTERNHTDEELICRTTKKGNVFRYTPKNHSDFQFLITEDPSTQKKNFIQNVMNRFK